MSALVLCGGVDAHDEREAFAADHGAKGQHGATGAGRLSRAPQSPRRAAAATQHRQSGLPGIVFELGAGAQMFSAEIVSSVLRPPSTREAVRGVLFKPKEASPETLGGG